MLVLMYMGLFIMSKSNECIELLTITRFDGYCFDYSIHQCSEYDGNKFSHFIGTGSVAGYGGDIIRYVCFFVINNNTYYFTNDLVV